MEATLKKLRYQTFSMPSSTTTFFSNGVLAKYSSISWKPCRNSSQPGRAEDHGQGGADGGIDGVTAANPVPEAERVVRVDAELLDLLQVWWRWRTKCFLMASAFWSLVALGDGAVGGELFEQPGAASRALVRVSRVVKVLETMMNRVVSGRGPWASRPGRSGRCWRCSGRRCQRQRTASELRTP